MIADAAVKDSSRVAAKERANGISRSGWRHPRREMPTKANHHDLRKMARINGGSCFLRLLYRVKQRRVVD